MTAFEPCGANEVDTATATLLLELQLEDCEEFTSKQKGKGRAGELSDADVAIAVYQAELTSKLAVLADQRMTRSIASAVQADGSLLSAAVAQEVIATTDRNLARTLSGQRVQPEPLLLTNAPHNLDDELIAKFGALFNDDTVEDLPASLCGDDDRDDLAESESSAAGSCRGPRSRGYRRCTACLQDWKFFDIARVSCKHEYCRDCLRNLFGASMTDETLFPPRCCRQPITIAAVRLFLPSELVVDFEEKRIEFQTPDKTYCCLPTCSAFIRAENTQGNRATCQDCKLVTCTDCKAVAHKGDCPGDVAMQEVLQLANTNGWQRCQTCRRMVELDFGCNHMTCRCGAQFCYLCGSRWKTCRCQLWDDARLYTRAAQNVDRRPAVGNQAHAVRVQQEVQHLREYHECNHRRWRYVAGPNQCEECRHNLPEYIFECHQCHIRACNQCKRHRL